jgi:hypothetical protein
VDIASFMLAGQFNAGHNFKAGTPGGFYGRRDPFHNIMIGNGDTGKPRLQRIINHLLY